MKINVLSFHGLDVALNAVRLSFNSKSLGQKEDLKLLRTLVQRGDSHAKVLRMVWVWLKITAPRYWWQEFDTYKIGVTSMSESTMHTILKRHLAPEDFENPSIIPSSLLESLNTYIDAKDLCAVKQLLPESFLQTRIVNINYQALRHIFLDRKNHPLNEWQYFIHFISLSIPYNDLIIQEETHEN